jgi:ABC-type sugar transport system substrate-binding protein
MAHVRNSHPRRGRRLLVLAVTCTALAGGLVVAGCGSDDNDSGGGASTNGDGGGTSTTANVSAADLQKTVDTALQTTDVKADSLPPLMKSALERATPQPSQEDMDKAFACFQKATCTLGDGDLVVGHADGFGDNTWRKFSKMSVILQSMTHPEIGKIIFTNAHGQLAAFQSDLRNLTAQGAKLIVSYNDFGPAAYPAFTAAQRAGAVVTTYTGPNDGAPTTAITSSIQPNICDAGKNMAVRTKEAIGDKGSAIFHGTPGNPQDAGWTKCAIEDGVNEVFQADTLWTPAGAQKATAALIASGKPAEAILYSYSNPVPNIVRTFNEANKPVPAIITWTQDNGTSCLWKKDPFTLYQTNALNWTARVAVDTALAKNQGEDVPAQLIYPFPFVEAKAPPPAPGKPADYPGQSALVPDYLVNKILGAPAK